MASRKHIPIELDVGPKMRAVAHVSPDISPEALKHLENIARAAGERLRKMKGNTRAPRPAGELVERVRRRLS